MMGEMSIQRWDMIVYRMLKTERNWCAMLVDRIKAKLEKQSDVERLEKLFCDVE